ncbi:MAG: EF-P lysine aminoacylase EpmA [Acidobacteriota bacterium]
MEVWRPTASHEALVARAEVLAKVRSFFAERGVLEVETPLLAGATVTDLHLHSLSTRVRMGGGARDLYLQTSPEFAMKRLLAAGSGSIFQIGRAFRDDERSHLHASEFTLLEWYRVGFDHRALMAEVSDFLSAILGTPPAVFASYGDVFEQQVGIDPHTATPASLAAAAERAGLAVVGLGEEDRNGWLELLMSQVVEPHLGLGRPTLVDDFPASQAALARVVRRHGVEVAERFEVYVEGTELANGYHELIDPLEQRRRFEDDLRARARVGLPAVPIDEHLLAALEAGLPPCAGIAMGVDRLVMLATGADHIDEVVAFPMERS